MRIKGLTKFSICFAALITSSVIAAPPPGPGWYFEGNIGASHISNANYGNSTKIKNSANLALNMNVGYKFMPFLGTEIGYTVYTNSKLQAPDGTNQGSVLQYAFDIAGKAILPFESGFELFTKLGGAKIRTKVNSSTAGINKGSHGSTGIYIGLGADYYYFNKTAIVLQWQRAIGNNKIGNFDLFSIGISYLYG